MLLELVADVEHRRVVVRDHQNALATRDDIRYDIQDGLRLSRARRSLDDAHLIRERSRHRLLLAGVATVWEYECVSFRRAEGPDGSIPAVKETGSGGVAPDEVDILIVVQEDAVISLLFPEITDIRHVPQVRENIES